MIHLLHFVVLLRVLAFVELFSFGFSVRFVRVSNLVLFTRFPSADKWHGYDGGSSDCREGFFVFGNVAWRLEPVHGAAVWFGTQRGHRQ